MACPMILYTDRGAPFLSHPESWRRDRSGSSDPPVGRALAQLGVEHIGAYSPQARGRSERMFGTLQDRLPKELRLAGITDIEAANAFIRDRYLPAHNARFAVLPAGEGPPSPPFPASTSTRSCGVEEERQVGNDNCVSCRTLESTRSPKARCSPVSSRRGSRCMSTRTAPTPSFTRPDASAATTRKAGSERPTTPCAPLKSARRRNPLDVMDKPLACPPRPQANRTRRSGHLMCCQNRTTQFAIETTKQFSCR